MGARSSEKILREFVRLAQDRSLVLEGGSGGDSPQLTKAINYITNNTSDIQYCLDLYENPVQIFTGEHKRKLEDLVKGAIAIDKSNNSPLTLILLSDCFGNKTDYTNFVALLGDLRTKISEGFIREGTIRTAAPPTPSPGAPVRGGDFGWPLTGRVTSALRAMMIRPDLADDMAIIISHMIGGAQGAQAVAKSGNLPQRARLIKGQDASQRFIPGSERDFVDAVRLSLYNLHQLKSLEQIASSDLKAAMTSGGYGEFTVSNLSKAKSDLEASEPALSGEAENLLMRAKAEIRSTATPENCAAVIRAIALSETMVVKGVPTKLRPGVGAIPSAIVLSASASALATSLLGIYDYAMDDPSISTSDLSSLIITTVLNNRDALKYLAEAFYRLGMYKTRGEILGIIPMISASGASVNDGLTRILAALAAE